MKSRIAKLIALSIAAIALSGCNLLLAAATTGAATSSANNSTAANNTSTEGAANADAPAIDPPPFVVDEALPANDYEALLEMGVEARVPADAKLADKHTGEGVALNGLGGFGDTGSVQPYVDDGNGISPKTLDDAKKQAENGYSAEDIYGESFDDGWVISFKYGGGTHQVLGYRALNGEEYSCEGTTSDDELLPTFYEFCQSLKAE
jgi:hypothetical protein